MQKENNIAFIDAQNLHLGTSSENWKIDFKKILFPNNKYSSLYKQIKTEYRQNLSLIKHKIEYKKRGVLR